MLRAIETAAVHLPQEMNSQRRGHIAAGAIDGLKIYILEHLKSHSIMKQSNEADTARQAVTETARQPDRQTLINPVLLQITLLSTH